MNALYFSGGLIQSRQISCIIISTVIYVRSYHFIAISTSYSNAAGFLIVPVISRIESIGGGVGGGGGWGAVGGLKHSFGLKEQC